MIDISIHRQHQKFQRDSLDYEDENFIIRTDGVFTSVDTSAENSLVNHLLASYKASGEAFVKDLRGSFLVYLFDKSRDRHLVYTNHSGDKRIYYYHLEGLSVISNSLKELTSRLKERKLSYEMDKDAAYFMLTYGYLFGNRTIVSEAKLLRPGQYLSISKELLEVKTYHTLDNTPNTRVSFQDALEESDFLFRQAITREYEKDRQYGLTSLASLSGGLDSRMCTWVAHVMGFTPMTNLTFGQKSSLDSSVPEQIVHKLKHQWIYIELADGHFLTELDNVMALSEGETSYLAMSHGKYAIDQVDFSNFGVLHTGQLGDVIMGSYCSSNEYGKPEYYKATTNQLIPKLPQNEPDQYKNLELMRFQNRGFNWVLSGNLSIQPYSEVTSPFMDVDYMDFCMSLPLEYRTHHRLYKQWILQKYPEAAAYKWDKLGRKITERTLSIRGKDVSVSNIPGFILKGIKHHLNRVGSSHRGENTGMNPFQYWYNTDQSIQLFMDRYYNKHLDLLSDKEIRLDCERIFSAGSIYEKSNVLSLLSIIKLYWD